ncbi:DUF2634 domain-containing protein [Lachnoclostridium phytofermentans]|uniref:Phage protein n=1 Tax=Lachnoclostridium phytofermentans (strain ATCC 700394 / DSM 18823 / ISDg) TaxID=357809 RepID=A9KPN4_LACP7|nr:DUF2634 domain-containing protein [Lachnoclostridium phytofermentans]ABX43308.1 phage protein [Lachnoclostridium phytofermentans ISDg]
MVPQIDFDITTLEITEMPSKTFALSRNKVIGTVDGLEAIKQSVYMALSVERYEHLIYSWDYGVELEDLFGKDPAYVYPTLIGRIEEALLQDDRILGVDEFSFASNKGSVTVKFTVHTAYGDIEQEKEVNI